MTHEFIIMRNNVLETYNKYEDIPKDFQHIIKFNPEIPKQPHTPEQHDEIESWLDKFNVLINIEKDNGTYY